MTGNDNETETNTDTEQKTRYSPAGFDAPEPETNNEMVVCMGCGESDPASEMGISGDETIRNGDDEILQVTRRYIHSDEDCMMEAVKTQTSD